MAHAKTPNGFQVVVEDLKSGTVRNITPPERNIGFPFWSPDGHWIGAQERIRGNTSFVIIPATGGQPVPGGIDECFVSDWAPDGDRVVYSSRVGDGNTWNAFWISRSTGRARQRISA